MKKIIPLLAAVALLAGCSSLTKVTRPDPENPEAPSYVEIEFDGKNQIDIKRLYRQGFRKVIVKNVRSIRAYDANDRKTITTPAIKKTGGTNNKLLVTDELIKAYPNLIEQIENNRWYDLWLQLEKESSVKGDKKSRVVVAYVKDIEGLRSVEEIEAEQARKAEEEKARKERFALAKERIALAEKERAALAERIIVKKYGSLFSSYSDYKAWKERCDGKGFANSLIAGKSKAYSENDMFIVEKYKLEIMDMQFAAGGGFAYLVGGLGHISGYSRPCYLISATQIPYLAAQGRSMITAPLLLQYVGQNQYREGYQVKTCDVFLTFAEGSREYKDYQNMMDDLQRIEQNPSGAPTFLMK